MERTGFKKRVWGGKSRGFSNEDKKKALNCLRALSIITIKAEPFEDEVPYFVKRIFPEAEKGDTIAISPFIIIMDILEDKKGEIKDAVIRFYPRFDLNAVYFFKREEDKQVLALPNTEKSYKLFCLFILRRKEFLEQGGFTSTRVQVEELLKACQIKIDSIHPKRTYEALNQVLVKAKETEIIKNYRLLRDGEEFTKILENDGRWVDLWLSSDIEIVF